MPAEENDMKHKKVMVAVLATLGLQLSGKGLMVTEAQAQDTVRVLDEVLIKDSRAGEHSPFTTSQLSQQELQEQKIEVSVPYMLELQPSVVVAGENGRMGETAMRIRGVDGSRINVNINGITLNDPESQSVFWYNVPNLGGMAQSIQIQRGIGASTGGTASFGGAINLQTLNAPSQPYGQADISVGSWNSRQYGIAAGTGISRHGLALDIAYNGQGSDGYIRGGFADQQSLYAAASRYGERSLLRALAIIGTQHTGITWNGESAEDLDRDPTYNSAGQYSDAAGNTLYYANESDNYNQRRYQLLYSLLLGEHWSLKAVADLTHGDGYYEQYKAGKEYGTFNIDRSGSADFVVQKNMYNTALTGNLSASYRTDRLTLTLGETLLHYDGDHYGSVIYCSDSSTFQQSPYEWYRNKGRKQDATTYLKAEFKATPRTDLYADLQLRLIDYSLQGYADDLFDMDFSEQYTFFNPKAGINWQLRKGHTLYAMAGLAHREPTRSDIKDALGRGDTIRAEAMLDIEAGYRCEQERHSLGINGYAMLYHDQLTPSGDLSSSGYALMENVERSYRMGIELTGGVRITEWLRMDANMTLSTNRIIDYTYTDFAEGDTVLQTLTANTDLAYSPTFVGAAIATFEPVKALKLQLTGKYVGAQYMDNTSRECYRQPAYFLLNAKVSYTWHLPHHREIEAQLAANNLLDSHYRIGAWAGDDYWEGYHHYCGWYQQPGINFTGRVAMKF